MADYGKLIDTETWEFLGQTAAAYPADAVTDTIEEQRRAYDAMCMVFNAGRPEGVSVDDLNANDVPVRHYSKNATSPALILYMHGGGFVVGGLHSHDDVCAEFCDATGFDVVSVDYRLTPENKHPAAFDDCVAALKWVRKTFGEPVIFAGDSAGGNLAAALAHVTRGDQGILGQLLIYPGLGGDQTRGSYIKHANAPGLTLDDIKFYEGTRTTGDVPKDDANYAPLWDTSFANLPSTIAISAECDPLCDDGATYCDRILAAGGKAVSIEEPGLVHGYLRARHSVSRARESFARMIRALLILGHGKELTEKEIRS